MPVPINFTAAGIDLTAREGDTSAVTASPADATETVIATLVLPTDVVVEHGVLLWGWCAFTVGTNGTASNLRLRRTNLAGTLLKATGALTTAAAALFAPSIHALDTAPAVTGQTYVLTLQVTGATVASTVSAVELSALIV